MISAREAQRRGMASYMQRPYQRPAEVHFPPWNACERHPRENFQGRRASLPEAVPLPQRGDGTPFRHP